MRKVLTGISLAIVVALVIVLAMNFTTGEKKIKERIESLYGIADPQFRRSMGVLLGPSIQDGNRIEALSNGDEIFPAMLRDIRSAQKTITFETYIYWSGRIGKEFADALSERARAGVRVHVLLDWVGSGKMDEAALKEMEDAGVHVRKYHPLRWYHIARLNNRTHRKLLVVDGRVGFTGGVGIADEWSGHAQDERHWRDTHFRLEGPAVGEMQAAFMDNWLKTEGEVLHGEDYFPALPPSGSALAQVFVSSSGGGSESARLMYLLSIASARKSVRLAASYFVPDDLSVETLVAARRRGVKIEILLPGDKIDSRVVRRASRARWGDLLRAGVELYEYQPTMYHCKVMIVDDLWVSVGSTNFDNRSFSLNDEANLNVLDAEFAAEQVRVFEQDKLQSRRIT
ncbi:MAG TPA: phospholipase D-like domain-containing protein, partial [Candidatus Polarisedimenticolaceae bacterium]|nr:phospholipase D-like domain-containing protein [Candidatus Polarisedimenticolaceae bacterium]